MNRGHADQVICESNILSPDGYADSGQRIHNCMEQSSGELLALDWDVLVHNPGTNLCTPLLEPGNGTHSIHTCSGPLEFPCNGFRFLYRHNCTGACVEKPDTCMLHASRNLCSRVVGVKVNVFGTRGR